MSLYCDSARQLARAEADYLRAPEERDPRCYVCDEAYDADAGEELHLDEAVALGLASPEIVCPTCAAAAREALALEHAMRELGRLRWQWQKRAMLAAGVLA